MEAEGAAKRAAGKEHWAWSQKTQVEALTLLLTSYMTLGESPSLLSLHAFICATELTIHALSTFRAVKAENQEMR